MKVISVPGAASPDVFPPPGNALAKGMALAALLLLETASFSDGDDG